MLDWATVKANHDFNVTNAAVLMMNVHVLFDPFTYNLI
jgi:hypothetical protein